MPHPPGRPLGHGRLNFCSLRHGYSIQMSNSLLGSLMGELPGHLHLMVGLLESPLQGYYFFHVAGPGMYAQ